MRRGSLVKKSTIFQRKSSFQSDANDSQDSQEKLFDKVDNLNIAEDPTDEEDKQMSHQITKKMNETRNAIFAAMRKTVGVL